MIDSGIHVNKCALSLLWINSYKPGNSFNVEFNNESVLDKIKMTADNLAPECSSRMQDCLNCFSEANTDCGIVSQIIPSWSESHAMHENQIKCAPTVMCGTRNMLHKVKWYSNV